MATQLLKHEKFTDIAESIRREREIWVQGLLDSSRAYFIAALLKETHLPCIVIGHGHKEAELMQEELQTFLPDIEIRIYPCLSPLICPHPSFPHPNASRECGGEIEKIGRRMATLAGFLEYTAHSVTVTSIQALLQKVISQELLQRNTLKAASGKTMSMRDVIAHLDEHGYERVDEVSNPSEFSSRGGILDVFPIQTNLPLRIEFAEEKVESIRKFRPETQRSAEKIQECSIFPVDGLPKHSSFFSYIPEDAIIFLNEPALIKEKAGKAEVENHISYDEFVRACRDYRLIYLSLFTEKTPDMEPGKIYDLKLTRLSDTGISRHYQKRTTTPRMRGIPVLTDSELKIGDYVVHINHGIGKYLGLEEITTDGEIHKFLTIEYLGGDKLYVSPLHIHLVEKYAGIDGKPPPLYRLGGSSWKLAKQRAVKAIRDMAGELLELYATRETVEGFKFSPDTSWQLEFESSFIYEETPDQSKTIEEVKIDMESPKPMDRLVCGDSGYGKTEIAMRAAFKAVMDGKQAAVLAPTTILAEQHHTTFCERMANYPINVAVLSRFKTPGEQKQIVAGLKNGTVDIVIGTHRLLQNDISFRDMGLIIIDEEQGHLVQFSTGLIRNTILREIERDGQVFYVHNRVESIGGTAKMLEELVPPARIRIAHGQMLENELEKVMEDFMAGRIDVLVCTTIVESGLDIPNANTIIIDSADTFGLADLYQLKGRVGRYTRDAHAFFIIPPANPVNPEAKKRLKAIQELCGHGAGFRIAMKDLEIRGAGNLLGPQQHGHIIAIGFGLYYKLLRQTVRELRR